MTPPSKTSTWGQRARDSLLFLGGLGGMVHQTLIAADPKPILIGAFLLMLGLPASFFTDRLFQRPTQPPGVEPKDNDKAGT